MVTDTQETQVIQLVAQGPCELVIVAVGGGGVGDYGDFSGGSGSGFVEWRRENLTRSIELEVSVGRTGRRSTVSSNGTILVEAAAGGGPSDYTGGSGYSGGGGGGKDRAGKGILFAFHSIFGIKYIIVSFFFFCQQKDQFCLFLYLPAKGPILPFALFASIGGENGQSGGFGFGAGDFYGPGGFGSGLDIATIPMKIFTLT